MDRDEVEVHKLAKKRTRPTPSHLDRTNLVNKGFIIWLLVKFCSQDVAGSPERARWLHLARSGSQSQCAIWFILPAHGASHIIMAHIPWWLSQWDISASRHLCLLFRCGSWFIVKYSKAAKAKLYYRSKLWLCSKALHSVRDLPYFGFASQPISRQTIVKSMRFHRLHDQWNWIVLKTLHFWKRIQNDPVLTTNLTGAVQTKGVTASKPMRLQMKPRPCKQGLIYTSY